MKRSGFTLIEVLVALGLFSILMLALVRLLDTSFTIWGGTQERRELVEVGSDVLELLARDLRSIEHGPRGDLFCAWTAVDLDGDGLAGIAMPHLALVRVRGAAEAARAAAGPVAKGGATHAERVEVSWFLSRPAADGSTTLLRAERVGTQEEVASLLERSLGSSGPGGSGGPGGPGGLGGPAGSELARLSGLADEVAAGCLWLSFWFASNTSVVKEGWSLGDELADCSASWDAWDRGRPDPDAWSWNEVARRSPRASRTQGQPHLPRRVRIELELERPEDLVRRTRLADPIGIGETELSVIDGKRLPGPGSFVRLDEEWMQILSVRGDGVTVRRARRGTSARSHEAGALLHHGLRMLRDVPLPGIREDWGG